ncbi:cupin domain-containing protein [Spirosoma sp. BT702]|uniref:Cupin domain-containing protein n=1 Tax=Spirosoma profusum TaxID=2771354 RepID=A0A926Y3D9_9BACT|nr:cupin domain-containing protein [Spirosoma profusum]MBD2703308.1 cupin domain-containing protein [Spirosoma profusum]
MERRHFLASGLLAGFDAQCPSLTQSLLPAFTHSDRGPLKPFYSPPEPTQVGPNGLGFRVPVRSNQTNGQFSCMEGIMGPKLMGPAPHVHKELDELMFVQEGTVSILVGDKVYEVEAGGWHLRPHGLVHTFWNATDKPVRYIDMFFNQDFENFLEEMFARLIPDLMKRGVSLTSKEATDKMNALYTRYGITMFEEQRQPIMAQYGLKG